MKLFKNTLLNAIGILVFLTVSVVGPNCNYAIYTWPLGYGFANREVNQSYPLADLGDVTYGLYGDSGLFPLNYSAMAFKGTQASYADLYIEDHQDLYTVQNDPDYVIQMYVYLYNNSAGTLFEFRSDNYETNQSTIQTFKAALEAGGQVRVYAGDFGTNIYSTNLQANTWYHFIFERDWSQAKIRLTIDRIKDGALNLDFNALMGLSDTSLPGTIRIGGSFNQSSPPLNGKVACVQLVPGKDPVGCVDHDSECFASLYNGTTTPLPTTSTPTPTPATTSTTPPTTTSTTTPTRTSTTTPATTSTTTPATTSTTNPATTSTTTPTTTSTTTHTTTSTTTPATTSTTTHTTTSTTPPATTTPSPTATSTTATTVAHTSTTTLPMIVTTPPIIAAMSVEEVHGACLRFEAFAGNVTFGTSGDILDVTTVQSYAQCSVHCAKSGNCMYFAVLPSLLSYTCTIGHDVTTTTLEMNSTLFRIK